MSHHRKLCSTFITDNIVKTSLYQSTAKREPHSLGFPAPLGQTVLKIQNIQFCQYKEAILSSQELVAVTALVKYTTAFRTQNTANSFDNKRNYDLLGKNKKWRVAIGNMVHGSAKQGFILAEA